MGYIPPVPFLSHYPFKCSASTEVRALYFRWGPRHKVCLEGGGGGYFVAPFMNKTLSTKMFIAMYCFAFAYYSITTSYNHGQIYSNNVCNFDIDRHVFDRTLQVFIRR